MKVIYTSHAGYTVRQSASGYSVCDPAGNGRDADDLWDAKDAANRGSLARVTFVREPSGGWSYRWRIGNGQLHSGWAAGNKKDAEESVQFDIREAAAKASQ